MEVIFLGTGTSQGIPVIACDCSVCRSKNKRDKRLRSSVMVTVNDVNLIIDTGPDFRQQMLREQVQKIRAVLFTHEHKDHVAGLDDVRPFNYKQKTTMPVYCTTNVQEAIRREFSYAFTNSNYPGVPRLELNMIDETPFYIDDIEITPIPVMHSNLPVLGFRIGDFTYITDANFIDEKYFDRIYGSKVLVLNALRIEKHLSHFNLDEALEMIKLFRPEKTFLTHISHQLGHHSDIEKKLPENVFLAYDSLKLEI